MSLAPQATIEPVSHTNVRTATGGKSIVGVAHVREGRGPFDGKDYLHVKTDDGTVYEWARLRDGEPWAFERRVKPDGTIDTSKRPLPNCVSLFVRGENRTGNPMRY